ncbi:MAG: hypothetical protein IPH78_10345 [Bacteroidetes bacterium]|nr:hypothetical protein [Bacteroidota bacterium]MBK8658874.1 hypothetical protein [Bacteroidota bacterium]
MKRLAIIGSGDLAQQIIHHSKGSDSYLPTCLFDDYMADGDTRHGLPVKGGIGKVLHHFESGTFDVLMIGIGYKHMQKREEIYNLYAGKIPFGTIIHPSCTIDSTCRIGEGSFLYPGVIADMNVRIGKNTIIYNGCVIAHDSRVGNHTILSPSVSIAGFSNTGDNTVLGIGTVVSDNVTMCNGVKTGAGAVVVKSITEKGLYIGCPAKLRSK